MTEKPLPLTTYLGEYSRPEYALSMWLKAFLHDAPTKDARPIELLPNFCMDGARQILDNLPRLHEQSLDTLIRLATEKAHAAGMRIELIVHGPEETPEPNVFGPSDYERAKQHIGKAVYFSDTQGDWNGDPHILTSVSDGAECPYKMVYLRFKYIKLAETPEPTDRLTSIEARLDALEKQTGEHANLWRIRNDEMIAVAERWERINEMIVTPAPAQPRTYQVVEWVRKTDRQLASINGIQIGEVWDDGTWRLGIEHPFSENGNVESAKHALESKFRQWWDELHPQQS